ncbi:MAG: hypothetical protein HYY06_03145 [Deltaproteobacteria bacterium]|nr:hypothetical protein [Deltaproteobacteria bacterium]
MKILTTMSTLLLAAALALSGCAGGDEGTSEQALLEAPPGDQGLGLSLHASLSPAESVTYCHYVALPENGGAGLDVAMAEHRFSEGSTEIRLYRTDLGIDDVWAQPGRFACDEAELEGAPSYASADSDGSLDLPQGVALHFEPREVVLLVVRFSNSSDAAIDAEARLNLWFATEPVSERAETFLPGCEPAGTARADAGGC